MSMNSSTLALFSSKQQILLDTLNKYRVSNENDTTDLITLGSLYDDKSGDIAYQAKQYLSNILKVMKYFHRQSTKSFTNNSGYGLFQSITSTWKYLNEVSIKKVWVLLSEMIVLCVTAYPIIKQTDYPYIRVLFYLESTKDENHGNDKEGDGIETDVDYTIPPAVDIVIGCVSVIYNRLKDDIEKGIISTNLVERLSMEFEVSNIKDWEQKIKSLSDNKEVSYIVDIISEYITEPIKQHVHTSIIDVMNGEDFQTTTRIYTKQKIVSMIHSGDVSFEMVSKVMVDSGLMNLFGDRDTFPTTFSDAAKYIHTKTGIEISEQDAHSFITTGISQMLESPQFNQMCDQFGVSKTALDPILHLFNLKDKEEERRKRQEEKDDRKRKRMKKKMKKLKNDQQKKNLV